MHFLATSPDSVNNLFSTWLDGRLLSNSTQEQTQSLVSKGILTPSALVLQADRDSMPTAKPSGEYWPWIGQNENPRLMMLTQGRLTKQRYPSFSRRMDRKAIWRHESSSEPMLCSARTKASLDRPGAGKRNQGRLCSHGIRRFESISPPYPGESAPIGHLCNWLTR